MKYQLAGLQASLLIHAALFVLAMGVSRLLLIPSNPITIEIGILASLGNDTKKEAQGKIESRQVIKSVVKPTVQQTVKPIAQQTTPQTVQQQEINSETAVAQKPVEKHDQALAPEAADASLKTSELGTNDGASAVVGPVFDVDYLHNPKPEYPAIARRMKLEGTVIVQVLVNAAGNPEVVRLGRSSGTAVLDQAALQAVQNWSFVPARQGTKPIPAWVDIPLRFRLI